MNVQQQFWDALIGLNAKADELIEKALKASEPSPPIGREIPVFTSIEARFNNLPPLLSSTIPAASDARAGNNVKREFFTNKGSRIYIRELSFKTEIIVPTNPAGSPPEYDARIPNVQSLFPFNFRWNFQTSITGRWYSDRRCLAKSAGRFVVGNKLSFKEPLVIEPMETFTFECELLGGFNMQTAATWSTTAAIVAMHLSGYREGM